MQGQKLNGLRNEGATCYMNSLLQTLFMTSEFRSELYSQRFNESPSELIDNIPYQLQRLFINMQYSDQICSTKKLIKSFQWEDNEKFQQHDVQEFCRVLFDAIESSSEKQWIHKNYAGLMKSFVRCENGHSSQRLENFLDLSLTIKNPFENIQNHSVQEAIKGYLKPEKLEYGNKYLCEECGEKVNATKGLEFVTLPKILTIQLKRFQLNYETMQREKINEFVYYPQILEMEKFIQEYEKVEIGEIPKELQEMRNEPLSEETKKKLEEQAKVKEGKLEKGPMKRKNSEEKLRSVEQVSFLDDISMGKEKKEVLTTQEEKLKNIEALKNLQFNKDDLDKKFERLEKKQRDRQAKEAAPTPPPVAKPTPPPPSAPVFDDIDDDILFGIGGAMIAETTNWQQSQVKITKQKKGTSSYTYSHKQQVYNNQKQYKPNTYSLFAVLVHDGNAYSGHYYAYIKSGEEWYRFDDSRVTKATEIEVRKYGDLFKFHQGANAYMLFYRNVNTIKDLKSVEADEELVAKSLQDPVLQAQDRKLQEQQIKKNYSPYQMRTLEKPFRIKLYYPKPSHTILDNVALTMTLQELKDIIRQQFSIEQLDENWRLRIYNSYQDTLLTPIQDTTKTLKDLNLKQTVIMTIEFKQPDQIFQEFDPRVITLNINVWRQGLFYQKQIIPVQIKIRDDELFTKLLDIITQKTSVKNPKVLRRSFVKYNNVAQEVYYSTNSTLLGLRFFNNLILYVEEQGEKVRWQEEFDTEKYKVTIRYNNPTTSEENTIAFDNRKPFIELKQHISGLINLPSNEFRVKLNQESPELTGRKRLSDLRIVGEVRLFLELGKSIKDIINISKGRAINTGTGIDFEKGEEEQYEIQVNKAIDDLRKEIVGRYSLPESKIRIREYKRGFGEILKGQTTLSKIKDKVLVWEEVEDEFRGLQLYTRLYKNQILQEFNEVFVEYDATYQQLAMIIAENYSIHPQTVEAIYQSSPLQNLQSLESAKWVNVNYQDGKMYEGPLYLSVDGIYLIIKQGDKQVYKPKSKAAKQVYTYGGGSKNGKQKALTITVKKKQDKSGKQKQEPSQQPSQQPQQNHPEKPVTEQ